MPKPNEATEPKQSDAQAQAEVESAILTADPGQPGEIPATAKTVVYFGQATTRQITAEEWKRAGVEGVKKTVWNRLNKFAVPVSELNEAQLDILRADGWFKAGE